MRGTAEHAVQQALRDGPVKSLRGLSSRSSTALAFFIALMSISLHPSAITVFDEKAGSLLQLVKEIPRSSSGTSSFPSEVHVAASITEQNIIGQPEESLTDYQGNTVSRYFHANGKRYGLEQESYDRLRDLASSICSIRNIKDKLSTAYVEKELFKWIERSFADPTASPTFCETLTVAATQDITKSTSWIPIANLEIETPFPIGSVELRPISPSVIDTWEAKTASIPEEHRANAAQLFAKVRQRFQGRAAVIIPLEAEPNRAYEVAVERAELATSLLAIFSLGALLPDVKCLSKISGSESLAQATVLSSPDDDSFRMTENILDRASARAWRLDRKEIVELRKSGLDAISALLNEDDPNEFKRAILNALIIYSKSAFTAEPVEKIIYILSSLESMLLKNETEPIQQNLAERMAIFIARDLAARKKVISNVKSIYGVRSRYLHHGHQRSEIDSITEFMNSTWVFYVHVLANANQFSTRLEFVSAIDDAKLS